MNLALATILALAAPAAVVVPAGWKVTGLEAHAQDTSVVDAATKAAATEQYMPATPDPGITLFVTRSTASELRGTRDTAIRAIVDELRARGPVTQASTDGQLELTASWHDAAVLTQRTTRLVIAADATQLVTVTGECIAREDAAVAQIEACKAALATLDVGIAKADRAVLALPPASAPEPPPTDTHAGPTLEPARLGDGTHTPFAPIVVPPAPQPADRRPMYVGAGVVLLALVFWWNRRQRDRFEREDGPTPPRKRRRDRVRDTDTEDLQAAARGDDEAKKAEDTDER
jgi:hypothetical protein